MFSRYSLIFSLCLVMTSVCVHGIAPSEQTLVKPGEIKTRLLADQRIHYELAKLALDAKATEKFERHYAMLGDYPLAPYLDYTNLKNSLSTPDYARIDLFFASNRDSFLEARLRQQLVYTLGLKGDWPAFQKYYRDESASTELRCFALYGRYESGDLTALDEVADIWTRGKSLPKSCDPLFKVWIKSGKLDSAIAWRRFTSAVDNGKLSLARYIRSLMKGRYLRYADLMLDAHSSPYLIRKQGKFLEQSTEMQQVIAHGIKRYARINPKDALRQWELYEAQQLFPAEISTPVKMYLAKRLTYKDHYALAEKLIQSSREIQQSDVIAQQLRSALETSDWQKVITWLDMLDEEKQQSDRWLYWRARAQAELGILEGPYGHYVDIYANLSAHRSFYGFLAADKLGTEYSLRPAPEDVNPSTLTTVSSLPAMRRAQELWLTDNREEAQAEWVFATRSMNTQELVAAGFLAKKWGWYNGGINAMISGNLWDHLSLRFPLAFKDEIDKVANNTKLEPNLIYAVARQESAFSEKARSSAGAMGLMQLMPATAKQTAQKSGVPYRINDLYSPEHNLHLGSYYLNQLLEKYNGNRILATAAYNAGPHRVSKWLKDRGDLPFDVWIETIPFKETRGYVQNVLSYSVIYAYRLGKTGTFITEFEAN